MSNNLQKFVARYKPDIENSLAENLPLSNQRFAARLNRAMQYAIFPGGKRWRPVLTLLGGRLAGAPINSLLLVASAIEYLHTSSLILDDLPSMDDADRRRGKVALHLAFDESTALLTALALMNHSYALLTQACKQSGNAESIERIISLATDCIGVDGMIGGQIVDLELRGACLGMENLVSRNLKTTALMRLMMMSGAITVGASEGKLRALASYGDALGAAYQIGDDLLDEVSDSAIVGKPVKQDRRHLRPNFVGEYGTGGARKIALEIIEDGVECLKQQFGDSFEVALLAEAAKVIIDGTVGTGLGVHEVAVAS